MIELCYSYNTDGTCDDCEDIYELNNKNKCELVNNVCQGFPYVEECELCEDGYYISERTYQCIKYDGTKENLSNKNGAEAFKINYIFALLLLIISC